MTYATGGGYSQSAMTGEFTITFTANTSVSTMSNVTWPMIQTGVMGTTTISSVNWVVDAPVETDGERVVRIERQAARLRQWNEQEDRRIAEEADRLALRHEANQRAEVLLLSVLTPVQQAMWRERNMISIVGSRGGHYEIWRGTAGNVRSILENGARAEYCCHLRHEMPVPDNVLAQLLLIVNCEEAFLDLANGTKPRWFHDLIRDLALSERPALRLVS